MNHISTGFAISTSQKRLWTLQQKGHVFENQVAVRIQGELDPDRLAEAARRLVARHEMLRTTYQQQPYVLFPLQVVQDPYQPLIAVQTGPAAGGKEGEDPAAQAFNQLLGQPYDPARDQPLRLKVVQLGAQTFLLLIRLPALAADAHAMARLLNELMADYAGSTAGGDEEPLQFSQYSEWHNALLEETDEESRRFWQQQDFVPYKDVRLALEQSPPGGPVARPVDVPLEPGPALADKLAQLAGTDPASLAALLLTGWQVLLWQYAGYADDVVVGKVENERSYDPFLGIVGPLARTLPVHCRFSKGDTLASAYAQVEQAARSVRDWQETFAWENHAAPGIAEHPDGFAWGFEFADLSLERGVIPGAAWSVARCYRNYDAFRLWLSCTQADGTAGLALYYQPGYFDAESIRCIGRQYLQLLENMLAGPDTVTLGELLRPGAEETGLLLRTFTDTRTGFSPDECVIGQFERQAAAYPERVALVAGRESLSFAALNARANQLAHYLAGERGVQAGDVVMVRLPRTPELIVSILAVLKLGAAYLPVDVQVPRERLAYMCADSRAALLITDQTFGDQAGPPVPAPVWEFDAAAFQHCPAANPAVAHTPEDTVYVIFTSGSTGKPKGVAISNRSLSNYIHWFAGTYGIGPADRTLLFSSVAFDLSYTSLWPALVAGSTLVLLPESEPLHLPQLVESLIRHRITFLKLTPSHFSLIVNDPQFAECVPQYALRLIVLGGEKLRVADVDKYFRYRPEVCFVNHYGPTETTIGTIAHPIRYQAWEQFKARPCIGRPIANNAVFILDENGGLLPVGATGEICVAGHGVAKGYLNQPALTAEKFVAHPYGALPAERLYRTGDLGRWLPDGTVEFLGRNDGQVKVRGYRVELNEIGNALRGHPAVQDAVVVDRGENEEQHLVAYLVAAENVGQAALRAYLGGLLPQYMIPAYFVPLQKIPLTPNGKVNRRALPEPRPEDLDAGVPYVAPADAWESQLADTWQQVIGKTRVGTQDNYFALGGDSIKAIRLAVAINKTVGVSIEIKDIYQYPTIAALAAYIRTQHDKAGREQETRQAAEVLEALHRSVLADPAQAARLPADWEDFYPMSDIERGMTYYDHLNPGSGLYHDQGYLQISEPAFRYDLLRQALALLVEKHPVLRTSLHLAEFEQPLQVVHRFAVDRFDVDFADIASLSQDGQRQYLERFLKEDQARAFDLSGAGLWRLRVFHLGAASYGILWVTHHAIMDGWSNASFLTELSNTYFALKAEPAFPVVPLKASGRDYIIDQVRTKASSAIREEWRQLMLGYERTGLPLNKSMVAPDVTRSRTGHFFAVDPATVRSLEGLASRSGTTLQNICLAAFCYLLKGTTNSREVTVGLVTHGRPEVEDGDKILGCFLNTVPFRLVMPAGMTGAGLLAGVREQRHRMRPLEKLPFSEIAGLTGEETGWANPVYDVVFGYVDFHVYSQAHTPAQLQDAALRQEVQSNNFLFDFTVVRAGESLEVLIKVPAGVYQPEELQRLAGYYRNVLAHLAGEPEAALSPALLLDEAETSRLLDAWNDTRTTFPPENRLAPLFEAQARLTPDAVALVFAERQWTYRQLNQTANQLAHHLRNTYRVGPEQVVGILAERSDWSVIGMLGILKAGGAFLPIDPQLPRERVQYMLGDAGARVLLTDSALMFEVLDYYEGDLFALDVQVPGLEESSDDPACNTTDSQLAYVIYTSGSTGRPKGVAVQLGNIANYVRWANAYYYDNAPDHCFGLFTPLAFDLSLTGIFATLLRGGRLVVFGEKPVAGILADVFAAESGVTAVKMTPSHVNMLDQLGLRRTAVRSVILGGEALTEAQVATLRRLNAEMRVFNEYGPTETTVGCTIKEAGTGTVTIGTPIANTRVYLLDDEARLLPSGVVGEICIGGEGVARGYLNQPALTDARFVANPFATRHGHARLYRTGDLGRWLPGGEIELLGRKDSQVKLRGYRVEPGEVESLMRQHNGVQDAHIILTGETGGDQALEAVVVPNDQDGYTARRLARTLRENPQWRDRLCDLPNGMKVFYMNRSETDLIYLEIFDEHTYLQQGIHIKPGDVIFDVGANIGMFSLYAGLHFPGVRLYAFEPLEPVYAVLRQNASLYPIDATVFNFGLSDQDQTVNFSYYANNTVLSGRYGDQASEKENVRRYLENQAGEGARELTEGQVDDLLAERVTSQTVKCRLRRLSDVIRENGVTHIDLLKVDAEKSELDVLHGIDEADWAKIRQVVVEVHDINGYVQAIEALLTRHGFSVRLGQDEILKGTDIYNMYGTRDPGQGVAPRPGARQYNQAGHWTDPAALARSVLARCEESLPAYMVPRRVTVVDSLPLTANGKVDKKALGQRLDACQQPREEYVAPRSPVEARLESIWKRVLDKSQVSVLDNFFKIGGHSLKATQVVSRIHQELNVKLDIGALFGNPTIAALAACIEAARPEAFRAIPVLEAQPHYALSPGQRRLWVLSQLEENETAFNVAGAYRLRGNLDAQAFEKSFRTLVARHEILRTVFVEVDGEPRQRVSPASDAPFGIACRDLRREADPEAVARLLTAAEVRRPFDLSAGPLLRVQLLRLADDQYVCALTMHHIVSDGWSMDVLMREFTALYAAHSEGADNPLAPLRIHYKEYADWQNRQLDDERLAAHQQYWQHQMSGEIPVLDFPADYPRPRVKSARAGSVSRVLDPALHEGLQALSLQHGTSFFMTLLASVSALLHRYTGQDDLIIGSPVTCRDHVDLAGQIGFYVNYLPLRIGVTAADTFGQLLDRVKQTALDAYEHQAYPFEQLVSELQLDRDMSRAPLFDVAILLLEGDGVTALKGLSVSGYDTGFKVCPVDLRIAFSRSGGELRLHLDYNLSLFTEARMLRMLDHFQALAASLVQRPAVPVGRLPYLTPAETARLLTWSGADRAAVPPADTVTRLFEEQVRQTPRNAAVVYEGQTFTYDHVNRQANKLAHYLRHQIGVRPGDRVALLVDRSPWLVVGMLGILKAGAAYLPIDPAYPDKRVRYMLEDAAVPVLLTESQYLLAVAGYPVEVIALDLQLAGLEEQTGDLPPVNTPADLAYVIYTSGSTGQPKGVMIEHHSLVNLCNWHREAFRVHAACRATLYAGVGFDASGWEVWPYLLAGAALYPVPQGKRAEAAGLAGFLNEAAITHAFVPTPVYEQLCEAGTCPLPDNLLLLTGGDKLRKVGAGGPEVVNNYGPTEATVVATSCRVSGLAGSGAVPPIGKPITNTRLYIVDAQMNLQPEGVTGEICVAGASLARGYLHRPELTRARFLDDPFAGEGRLYQTGDLGRWLPDGNVEYLGRKDNQVKMRGYRIEPGEIESRLMACPGVESAQVLAREDDRGEKYLVAYYVGDPAGGTAAVRDFLGQALPGYMVPAYLVALPAFPLTANGKVDLKALPAVEELPAGDIPAGAAPRNEREAKIAAVWEEVLQRKGIGVHDNFFSVGGHSLNAVKVIARLHEAAGLRIELGDLFRNPTVEGLARLAGNPSGGAPTEMAPLPVQPWYEVSYAQKRLWIMDQLESQPTAYNLPLVYRIGGNLNVPALEAALHALVGRHEALRTVFLTVDGELRQRVKAAGETGFALRYNRLPAGARTPERMRDLVDEEARKPFDLAEGPLLKAVLWQLADDQHVFLLSLHHIIADARSVQVLFTELLTLYAGQGRGEAAGLPPLPLQYKEFAAWQNQQLSQEAVQQHRHYWIGQFGSPVPVLQLPTDFDRSPLKRFRGEKIAFALEPDLSRALLELVRHSEATVFMGLLAAVKATLHKYSAQTDMVIGTSISGRDQPAFENVVGLFLNQLPLRTRFAAGDSFRTLLRKVRTTTLEAYAHKTYPFDRLVGDLNLERDPSRSPLFDVMVDFKEESQELGHLSSREGLEVSRFENSHAVSKFDFDIVFTQAGDQLWGVVEYNTDLFQPGTIAILLKRLTRIIGQVTAHPDLPLARIDGRIEEEMELEGDVLNIDFNF